MVLVRGLTLLSDASDTKLVDEALLFDFVGEPAFGLFGAYDCILEYGWRVLV